MCGLSAIVALEGCSHGRYTSNDNDEVRSKLSKELDESIQMIAHRGPNSRGQWISEDNRIGLSHCRLAINDLTPDGHQPMHDVDNDIHAVVNGEIYDYDRIRSELSREFDYQFQGHSDSELVIALYKHYGLSFFEQLRGEFAFCLYDSRTQFFLAARDRYGIKPLFWTVVEGTLLIAAEAKAFLPLGWKPEWDVNSLVDDGWHFGCRTLFRGVQKVRPGHYLTCTSFGHVELRQYWDIEYPDKYHVDTRTEEEITAGVRERLVEAIRLRLRADVPIGVYLSGGIDSSAVAGILKHLVKKQGEKLGSQDSTSRMACFSVAFDKDTGFDESEMAARTASWLDVNHHKLHMGEEQLAAELEDATFHTEHHNQNLNFVGKFALSRMVNERGYKVVLTGEGADEQFAGYPMYVPDFLRERDHAWPQHAMPEDERRNRLHDEDKKLAELLRNRGATNRTQLPDAVARELNNMVTAKALTAYQLPDEYWATWIVGQRGCMSNPLQTLANDLPVHAKQKMQYTWHPLHSGLYAWTKSHLANSILSCLGDRTEMAHSIEARTPFLDHQLTSYANSLPPSAKLRYDNATGTFTEKWVLREAAKPFVLDELYARRKHAYTAPVLYPENGPLHQLYKRLLTQDNIHALGFLEWDTVKGLLDRAFVKTEMKAMRSLNLCCQWVILGKRFGIARAGPM